MKVFRKSNECIGIIKTDFTKITKLQNLNAKKYE